MKKILCLMIVIAMCLCSVLAMEIEYKFDSRFDVAEEFYMGLARVVKNGQQAIINENGEYVLPFSETEKRVRNNGTIMELNSAGKAGFFNKNGVAVTEYIYDAYFTENSKTGEKTYHFPFGRHNDGDGKSDLISVSRNGKFGFINSYGTEVIPPQFEYAEGFYGGYAIICSEGALSEYGTYTGGKYGLITEWGEVIIGADECWEIDRNNKSFRMGYEGEVVHFIDYIDKTDIALIQGRLVNLSGEVLYGVASLGAKHYITKNSAGKPYVLLASGEIILPAGMYENIQLFGDGFVVDNKKIVNANNELLYESEGEIFVNGPDDKFAVIKIYENGNKFAPAKVGLVAGNGVVAVEPIYDAVFDMGEGVIFARNGNENILFDYYGNVVTNINERPEASFKDGSAPVRNTETNEVGYIKNPIYCPKVFVNGEKIKSDVDARIYSDRTFLPMRAVFEALGANVSWEAESMTAIAEKNGIELRFTIGSNYVLKNGEKIEIDAPAFIEKDRTMIPLRAAGEGFGAEVLWDGEERSVNITLK